MNNLPELPWVAEGRRYIGLRENVSKTAHNPILLNMLGQMGTFNGESRAWWREDETPWCGLYVGYILGVSKRYVVKEWYRAREWESTYLTKLEKPAYGCIVTFTRNGGGHVAIVVGVDSRGNLMCMGGNQSNMVSIAPFSLDRVTGYYWPSFWHDGEIVKSVPHSDRYSLPLLRSNGQVSTNEA